MVNKSQSAVLTYCLIMGLTAIVFGCSKPGIEETKSTVTVIPSPSETEKAEPYLLAANEQVYLSWIERKGDTAAMKLSMLSDGQWEQPKRIAEGANWFVNWADYPMFTMNNDKILAHFLEQHGDIDHAYDVRMTMSGDNGSSWSAPALLHDDGKAAEHGFVSMVPYGNDFMIVWLDGRNASMEGMEGMKGHEGHHGSMTLRAAIMDAAGNKKQEWELDNKTCDCCQTAMTITKEGPIVVYRDRSDEEIRDISVVRFVDGAWTKPATVYGDKWNINGCPVNGPRISAKNSSVAIAWFTAEPEPTVKVVFSSDGGKSFGQPILINDAPTIGRVDIELIDEETAIVSWMQKKSILAAKVYSHGKKDETIMIGQSSSARSSGFPQLAISKNKAVFAWTDDSVKNVRTAILDF